MQARETEEYRSLDMSYASFGRILEWIRTPSFLNRASAGNRIGKKQLERRISRLGLSSEVAEKVRRRGRCFIVGMGPSIAKIDPDALKDELVIGVNFILRTEFTPDLICVSDGTRIDFDNLGPDSPKLIIPGYIYRRHADKLAGVNAFHGLEYVSRPQSVMTIRQFDPGLRKIYWGASVICDLAIPLAAYLGFSKAYVLGLDGMRASFPVSHAWGHDKQIVSPHDSKVFHLHERAAILAERAGLEVFNASSGGVVEAFNKVSMSSIFPQAVRTDFQGDLTGKSIIFNGHVLALVPVSPDGNTCYVQTHDKSRRLHSKDKRVGLAKNDSSAEFEANSQFVVEPSFVRKDWISLRAANLRDTYVTRWDENGNYILRETNEVFSPYFSSFRLFESLEQAQTRIDTDKILSSLKQIRSAVGNLMMKYDKE